MPSKLGSERPSNSSTRPFISYRKPTQSLVLLYLDELSYREIALVLGISENNVGVKLNRAKRALSELMKGQSHDS